MARPKRNLRRPRTYTVPTIVQSKRSVTDFLYPEATAQEEYEYSKTFSNSETPNRVERFTSLGSGGVPYGRPLSTYFGHVHVENRKMEDRIGGQRYSASLVGPAHGIKVVKTQQLRLALLLKR